MFSSCIAYEVRGTVYDNSVPVPTYMYNYRKDIFSYNDMNKGAYLLSFPTPFILLLCSFHVFHYFAHPFNKGRINKMLQFSDAIWTIYEIALPVTYGAKYVCRQHQKDRIWI
jgi:hypothetical protein